jgi:hypothetical protein
MAHSVTNSGECAEEIVECRATIRVRNLIQFVALHVEALYLISRFRKVIRTASEIVRTGASKQGNRPRGSSPCSPANRYCPGPLPFRFFRKQGSYQLANHYDERAPGESASLSVRNHAGRSAPRTWRKWHSPFLAEAIGWLPKRLHGENATVPVIVRGGI